MQKKKWLLLILIVVVLGYLIISKVVPSIGAGIDAVIGPSIAGLITGIISAVNNSPIWQAWDIYITMAFGAIIALIFAWQGHNAYNRIRGAAVQSAAKEAGYQTRPVATPAIIPQTPTSASTPQTVEASGTPAPQETEST